MAFRRLGMIPQRPTTSTGTRPSVVESLPSWPAWLRPQHLTAPAEMRAHANLLPVLTMTGLTTPLHLSTHVGVGGTPDPRPAAAPGDEGRR